MQPTIHSENDIIVAGGGPSGLIAAIRRSARRREDDPRRAVRLSRGHGDRQRRSAPFSPFHYDDQQITMGIPQELVERLMGATAATRSPEVRTQYGSG